MISVFRHKLDTFYLGRSLGLFPQCKPLHSFRSTRTIFQMTACFAPVLDRFKLPTVTVSLHFPIPIPDRSGNGPVIQLDSDLDPYPHFQQFSFRSIFPLQSNSFLLPTATHSIRFTFPVPSSLEQWKVAPRISGLMLL